MKIIIECETAEERVEAEQLRFLWRYDGYTKKYDCVIDFPEYEECGAYYAPSQGGSCIKAKGHDEEQHYCP